MTDEEIKQQIMTRLTVPLWPIAAKALGLGRSTAYDGARDGSIETVGIGDKHQVPTSFLRKKLGLSEPVESAKLAEPAE